jgi:mannitol operon transcriptional antiterminator
MKDQDILDIRKALDNIQPSIQKKKQIESIPLKDKLMKLNKYSNVMLMILENFSTEKVNAKNLDHVIDIASAMLTTSEEEEKRLQDAFVDREEKGSTILGKKGVMLLHCRANIKQNTCIKVIQLEKPILVDKEKTSITSVVIMVAPLPFDATILEVMSAVSRSIISGDFLDCILYGNKEEMYQNLSYVLDQYMKELANE